MTRIIEMEVKFLRFNILIFIFLTFILNLQVIVKSEGEDETSLHFWRRKNGFYKNSYAELQQQVQAEEEVSDKENYEGCKLNEKWQGLWFQSGVPIPISIGEYSISSKGRCIQSQNGDKFIFRADPNCYKCVVFHEKHANVLHYKETYCQDTRLSLTDMCSKITGDNLLLSLFRLQSLPVPCPFRGSFAFSYNRGRGQCSFPVSHLHSCTDPSKMVFHYQSCPNVLSESTVEEMECQAVFREGSTRYLLGLMSYSNFNATSHEEKFRCFVYDKKLENLGRDKDKEGSSRRYKLSQSGDATCIGVSANEGGSILTLTPEDSEDENECQIAFPPSALFQNYDFDEPTQFQFANFFKPNEIWAFGRTGFKVKERNSERVFLTEGNCLKTEEEGSGKFYKFSGMFKIKNGCQIGYACVEIKFWTKNSIQVKIGFLKKYINDVTCNLDGVEKEFILKRISSEVEKESKECPMFGRFLHSNSEDESPIIENLKENKKLDIHPGQNSEACIKSINIGCRAYNLLNFDFNLKCGFDQQNDKEKDYECEDWWKENGTTYILAKNPGTGQNLYFALQSSEKDNFVQDEFNNKETFTIYQSNSFTFPRFQPILTFSKRESCYSHSPSRSNKSPSNFWNFQNFSIPFSIFAILFKKLLPL